MTRPGPQNALAAMSGVGLTATNTPTPAPEPAAAVPAPAPTGPNADGVWGADDLTAQILDASKPSPFEDPNPAPQDALEELAGLFAEEPPAEGSGTPADNTQILAQEVQRLASQNTELLRTLQAQAQQAQQAQQTPQTQTVPLQPPAQPANDPYAVIGDDASRNGLKSILEHELAGIRHQIKQTQQYLNTDHQKRRAEQQQQQYRETLRTAAKDKPIGISEIAEMIAGRDKTSPQESVARAQRLVASVAQDLKKTRDARPRVPQNLNSGGAGGLATAPHRVKVESVDQLGSLIKAAIGRKPRS